MIEKFLEWLTSKEAIDWLVELITSIGGKILFGLLVLCVGLFIIKKIKKFIKTSHQFEKLDPSLRSFLSSFASIALYIVLFITLAMVLGIPATSLITVLATCGAAIGLALQGALSNFAGGIMILLFKPFKVGDFVEATGESGTVSEITVVYTVLLTPDNKSITIPNGTLTNSVIKNYSTEETRRVDFLFRADYSCDSQQVKEIIENIITSHTKVLKSPEAFIRVSNCADSAVEYTARAWVNSADYWDVYFDVLEQVKKAFEEKDIKVPFPQMDVHVKQ